jgi:hypothetical protein
MWVEKKRENEREKEISRSWVLGESFIPIQPPTQFFDVAEKL